MGRLADAGLAMARALWMLPKSMCRSRACYAVRLAVLRVAQGDLHCAGGTVVRIGTSAFSSRRIADRLATVYRAVAV
ncbi:hypothetical protein OHT76_00230 [Streptomyces sp. NBC_00287]|uniref:hypothetical protein n=1 Tax=Streptomyces sp. NBC_00287 TaxID=2975702 RepID=UPI002E27B4DD|nr:hypothetical protein [Streptomyces sp. NBC_00287]